ncbi:hypothetical protein, partial, partial [Parasitella parasitica]
MPQDDSVNPQNSVHPTATTGISGQAGQDPTAPSLVPLADFSRASVAEVDAHRRESHVSFMDDTRSHPDGESILDHLRLCKEQYELVVKYVTQERQEMVDTAMNRLRRAEVVRESMAHMAPMARPQLQAVIEEQESQAHEIQNAIATFDGQLDGERER